MGVDEQRIIGYSLTPCFGFFEPELHGATCRPIMEIGKNTHRRFCRWLDKGVWERLLQQVIVDPDYEWLLIDATHIKVHPHGARAEGGNQDMGRTKEGRRNCLALCLYRTWLSGELYNEVEQAPYF